MARKTNKTAHVLDLISKAKETNQTDEMDEDISIDTIEENITSDFNFVGSQMATDNELSNQIKETLEQEMALQEESIKESSEIMEEKAEEKALEEAQTIKKVQEYVNEDVTEEITEDEYTIQMKNREFHVAPLPELDAEETFVKAEPLVAKSNQSSLPASVEGEGGYCYINILEEIVKERVAGCMKKFGVCTCSRCIADTIALALNGLPSKYVVTSKNDASPLLNYFTNYYAASVSTQLSQACLQVKAKPQH